MTAALLVPVLFALTHFLDAVERRPGATLQDPVLALFPAVNLTWLTFLIIYAGIIVGLVVLVQNPRRLLLIFQAYAVMALFRMAAMYLAPLEPPPLEQPPAINVRAAVLKASTVGTSWTWFQSTVDGAGT